MTTQIKRIVVLLFVAALLAIVNTGCNTAHGFGKDVEKAGDKIQKGTDLSQRLNTVDCPPPPTPGAPLNN